MPWPRAMYAHGWWSVPPDCSPKRGWRERPFRRCSPGRRLHAGRPTTTSPAGSGNSSAPRSTWPANMPRQSWSRREASPAPVVVEAFFALWRHLLTATDLRSGCAVLAVTVDAEDDAMRAHAGQVFRDWRAHLESLLVDGGLAPAAARRLAATTIAAGEGAVALARAEQDMAAFDLVEADLIAHAQRAR